MVKDQTRPGLSVESHIPVGLKELHVPQGLKELHVNTPFIGNLTFILKTHTHSHFKTFMHVADLHHHYKELVG
jgi:hypothetical protein